jgi:hypothetical protein
VKFISYFEHLAYLLFALQFIFEARYFLYLKKVKKILLRRNRLQKIKNKIYLRAFILSGIRVRAFPVALIALVIFVFVGFGTAIVALLLSLPVFYSLIYWNNYWISKKSVPGILLNHFKILLMYLLVAALGASVFSVLMGFAYKLIFSNFSVGSLQLFVKIGFIFGAVFLGINAAPLIHRMRFARSNHPDILLQNMKLLFGWAKMQTPKIYFVLNEGHESSILELVGSPKEKGLLKYTLFISERALQILKPSELDAFLRREICRAKLGYLNRGLLSHLAPLLLAISTGYLLSIFSHFYFRSLSRFQIVFSVSALIYWLILKAKSRAEEQTLDVLAIAKMGASKVVLYSALKKMAWEKGDVLFKSSFANILSPFKSSLSVYQRALVIFSKEMSFSKIIRIKSIRSYRNRLSSSVFLLLGLVGATYLHWPKEHQLLWAILQKNIKLQEKLVQKGAQVDSEYYRVLGISPFHIVPQNSERFAWLLTQVNDPVYREQLIRASAASTLIEAANSQNAKNSINSPSNLKGQFGPSDRQPSGR